MESTPDPAQQLRAAERAAAAPFVSYPPLPRWYPVVGGAWAALVVVAIGLMADRQPWGIALVIALSLVAVVFFTRYTRTWGVDPNLSKAPAELQVELRHYFWGVAVVVVAGWLAYALLGVLVSALITGVLVGIGLAWYERRYARAAEAVRRRLA